MNSPNRVTPGESRSRHFSYLCWT